jgi:hypothetical protein
MKKTYLVLETRHGASRAPVHLGIAICVATAAVRCWLMLRLVVVMVMVVVDDDDDDWGSRHRCVLSPRTQMTV